ncbi:hypothetical protein VW35_08930 [Devosia soli]|uniref:Glycosyl transferase family 1 n=1 Tax=Devosia soli TaxID=361041 RepID=A0A0F5LAD1_9HYPH|nr:glycosyltransferase family 4 protein [Devosia soli]KKB79303.1 hypothetical protein VW35_08930 [Devosia soli]
MVKLIFVVSEDWYFISHRLNLAARAITEGFEVVVCTRDNGQRTVIEATGARVVPFAQQRRGLNPFGLLHEAWRLSRIYQREKPDVTHHIALRSVVIGEIAAWLTRTHARVSAITGLGFLFTDEDRKSLARWVLRRVLPILLMKSEVIVQNSDDAAALTAAGVSRQRMHLIPGAGVDTVQYAPVGSTSKEALVMLASRMLWDKGVGEFVEAAKRLRHLNARFVLVGMADQNNPSCIAPEQLLAWQDDGLIEWWGHRDDMAHCLNQADVVCLPSYREGLPKVLLEAMACAKPCITTDVPGCRDAVAHGKNGLLVPAKDAAALANAIEQLLANKEIRVRMGNHGRERANNEFSAGQVTEQTFRVYHNLVTKKS